MGTIVKPNTFSASTVISSSEVNDNFDTIYDEFNGNIAAANLATSAVTAAKIATDAVETAKIKDLNVTTAKIADGAVTSEKLDATILVRAYRNAAVSYSTEADIVFDTEVLDLGSDFNTTTGIFTAPVPGHYLVYVQARGTNLGDGETLNLRLYFNGVATSLTTVVGASAAGDPSITAMDVQHLTTGQQIKATMQISTTVALAVGSTTTYIIIKYLGA